MSSRIIVVTLLAIISGFFPQEVQSEPKAMEARPLTLEEAVKQAAEQNPELKALSSDADAVKTKISRARYWEDPMIGVRFYQVPFSEPIGDTQDIDYIIRQKFPMGGKAKAQSQMAYHEYQHRLHLLSAKGRQILRDLKTTYYHLFSTQKRIAVSREMESNLRSMVEAAQGRLAANQVTAGDASLGQVEIAKVLVDRQSLLKQRAELEAKLKQLMAFSSMEEILLPTKLEMPEWEASLENLLQAAGDYHPSLASEKHHIEEKEWGVKAAKKEYVPDVNTQVEYVQRPGDQGDAFTGELMINVPLIVRKKRLGVQQAEAELASAQFMRQATRNDVLAKVQEIYGRLKAGEKALSLNRGTLIPQARQAFQTTSSAYLTGKIGFVDVLSALRMLLDSQMSYWMAFEEQAGAVFSMEEAVGLTREEFVVLQKGEAL